MYSTLKVHCGRCVEGRWWNVEDRRTMCDVRSATPHSSFSGFNGIETVLELSSLAAVYGIRPLVIWDQI